MNYIILFLILVLLLNLYFRVALRFGIVDRPNGRSSHERPTLLGGGIVFYLAVVLYFLFFEFQYPYFLAGMSLLSIVSFIDDIKPQAALLRLLVQFTSIALLIIEWKVPMLALPIPMLFALLLLLIIGVGFLNAFNFMDGINGMLGAGGLAVGLGLLYIEYYIVSFVNAPLLIVLLISLLIFNFYNFRKKAVCFAGDVGAMALAFVLLFLVGKLIIVTSNFSWIGLFTVFGVDVVLTIMHRIKLRENLLVAHRKHLFQIMANELNMPHLVVSSIYALIQILLTIGIIVFSEHSLIFFAGSVVVLSIIYYSMKRKFFSLHQSVV